MYRVYPLIWFHFLRRRVRLGPAARNIPQLSRPREVIYLTTNTAILIVAIITASIAFAALILKIVEVSRSK
jgi:hypothetical protein